jgi:signal transduction histidine kinase
MNLKRTVTLGGLVVFIAAFAFGNYGLGFDRWAIHGWADMSWTIAALVVGLKSLFTAEKQRGLYRTAWTLWGLGCLSWFLGMLVWDYLELVKKVVTPFPSFSDIGYLTFTLFFIGGMFYYRSSVPTVPITLAEVGNLGIILCTLVIVEQIILFKPLKASSESWFYQVTAVMYPVLYISAFLFGLVCFWLYVRGGQRKVLLLILLGIAVHAFVNTLYAYSLLGKTYEAGAYFDIYWIIGFAFIYWAASEQDDVKDGTAHVSEQQQQVERWSGEWEAFIPAVALLFILFVGFLFRKDLDTSLLYCIFPAGIVWILFLAIKGWWDHRLERMQFQGRLHAVEALQQSQEQLRQAQKMEAIGRLSGGIAHDFNNLLTAIQGYGEILEERLDPNHPLKRYAGEILKAAEMGATLTRQLLVFSRRQVSDVVVLDLNEVIRNMEAMLQRIVGEDIRLVVLLHPSPACIKTDRGQMEQVIMNLVINARDAMPNGGQIKIETSHVDPGEDRFPRNPDHDELRAISHVMLSVSDGGIGMDKEIQSHIFEPFFTTKDSKRGTGFGLSTVYAIVKQCGGQIQVFSEPGWGTAFNIYFPKVEESSEVDPRGEVGERTSTGLETILVVEDDPVLRDLIRESLRIRGYRVLEAGQGQEALERFLNYPESISLLVTDVVMPGMNGPALVQKLLPCRPGMKVLFISGYTGEASDHMKIMEWEVPFLQKPFTPSSLARKVREVLDRG